MVEAVILGYVNHHYDPELEDSKLISFLHNTLANEQSTLRQRAKQTKTTAQTQRTQHTQTAYKADPDYSTDSANRVHSDSVQSRPGLQQRLSEQSRLRQHKAEPDYNTDSAKRADSERAQSRPGLQNRLSEQSRL